jgi:hypothetical protein
MRMYARVRVRVCTCGLIPLSLSPSLFLSLLFLLHKKEVCRYEIKKACDPIRPQRQFIEPPRLPSVRE